MQYQINISLTDEDYLNFNYFTALQSPQGKKTVRKTIVIIIAIMLLMEACFFFIWDFSLTSLIFTAVITILYVVFVKPLMKCTIKSQVKQLKKAGKLPFDSLATIEFYDDKIVELSENKRIEYNYAALERICIVKDQYVYLFTSSASGYILPFSQITAQTDFAGFLRFLQSKTSITEYY